MTAALSSFSAAEGIQVAEFDLGQKSGASQDTKRVCGAAPRCPSCNVSQQALDAARSFRATGVKPQNPFAGFKLEAAWRSAFERWLLALSAAEGEEGSA
ncbi:hypothetical protein JJ685_05350 [Ramlibacter monticola]|uniref:Uncharacterized protein n=1 Tax=Ramlibacter monticola TaxID=1926872 RepID=A0A936YW38_9BURK|nr:hypothetical protein [Ramlibacter monticola]MBL0390564.1 hypothetical protein [Ramlibacter monticola]